MILFEKFGQHQPLNRQADHYAREGVPLSLSTLADQVGACTAVLAPLFKRLEAHGLAAERSSRVNCTATTPRFRCWPRARPTPPGSGSMCETTSRSRDQRRRARSSTTRVIGAASIRTRTWLAMPACSRPTPMAATASSMSQGETQVPFLKQPAGHTRVGRSSCWPTWSRTRAARLAARRRR